MPFTFPKDSTNKAGAVRTTVDGNNFYNPAVIFSSDGVSAISSTNRLPVDVQLSGDYLQEQRTQANEVGGSVMFSDVVKIIEIYNTDNTNTGTFNVNGVIITVPPGKVFKSSIGGSMRSSVTVSGAMTYILSRYT